MYWPWYLGAPALAVIGVGFWYFLRRPFAVSGTLARVVEWRETRRIEFEEEGLADDPAALAAALEAATLAEFGAAATESEPSAPAPSPAPLVAPAPRLRWTAQLTFLACIAAGALLATLGHGTLAAHRDLGAEFASLFGGGWRMAAVLVGGGFLVGFGTRMAGGCTSGHGLSGCARLQPGSLLATACFFGAAIGTSLLVWRLR